jgi:hypothetical protein
MSNGTAKDSLAVDFSKGPWSFDSAGQQAPILRLSCADGEHPAHEMRSYYERVANARLIAAAPELLEALEAARQFIRNGIELGYITMPDAGTPDSAHDTLPMIEAAIAKARGE